MASRFKRISPFHAMAKSRPSFTAIPRPRKRWPLILFVLLAIGAVAGTTLFANDRRNLRKFAEFLGVPLASMSISMKPPLEIPPASPPKPSPEPLHWPWIKITAAGDREPAPSSSDMCKAQGMEDQEKPAYGASPERGWECSMLRTGLGETHSASLFLQARGPEHTPADSIRVKFNLAGSVLGSDLADQALAFIRSSMALPADADLDNAMRTRLTGQADFYFIAGYHGMTFRQEIGDPSRYNLIGIDLASIDGRPQILATEAPARDIRSMKGPRLLTLPAGND